MSVLTAFCTFTTHNLFTVKPYLLPLLAILCCESVHAQNLPVFRMKDTVIITNECYFFDPGGFRTGYPGGTMVLTFHSASGSNLGLSFDSCLLAHDNDRVNVYDGSSVGSPLLTSISRQSGNRSVKSSGSSLTVQLYGYSYGTTGAFGWGAHLYSLVNNPVPTQFSTVYNGFGPYNFDLNDYDKDGDLDVLNGGIVYRNDSGPDSLYWFLKQMNTPVGAWTYASMATADFDGDGYKDAFIMGQYPGVGNGTAARLYINNKNGGFALSAQAFTGAYNGRCSVVDYNNDGKPDISYIGSSNLQSTAFLFKLYINNGDGTFTEQVTNVGGQREASLSWADTDGDGDMDLVINGADASTSHARFFVNNSHTFTEKGVGLSNSCTGQISFVDVNGDNKPDIVNTGSGSPGSGNVIPTQLLINGGNNTFTSLVHNLPSMRTTYTKWADYDNDGDADLLMSGTNSLSPAAYVYKNNGSGNFTRITIGNTESYSPVDWIDINKDGRLDVFVVSRNGYSYIAKNMGNDVFNVVTYPLPTITGTGGAAIADFENDGFPDILYAGNLGDYDCIPSGSAYIKGMGWKFLNRAKMTPVFNIVNTIGNPGYSEPFWKWADFDNDGLTDIILTPNNTSPLSTGYTLKIYKNQGNNSFALAYDGQPGGSGQAIRKAAFVDLDNDGKNELVLAPNIVYKWNGTSFDFVYQGSGYCCDKFNMEFADYNKDGYLDMALNVNGQLRLHKNDKTGKLVEVNTNLTYQNAAFIKWADMDADGDLDLVASNFILENINTDRFVYKAINIPQYSGAAIGDFNGDGTADIFALTIQTMVGPTHLYYSQGPNFYFKENTPAGFPSIANGSYHQGAVAVDIDNDGDLDILHSTNYCVNGLIINNGNLLKQRLQLASPAGGEKLYTGGSFTIRWTGDQLPDKVAILYSTDKGKTYQVIDSIAPSGASGGSFVWQVPNIIADSCLIRITDHQSVGLLKQVFAIGTLATPQLSDLLPAFCQNRGAQAVNILNLPPAADNITVSATLDGVSLPAASGAVQFRIDTLSPGKHGLKVMYSVNTLTTTAVDSFMVVAAVTPKVGVQASTTSITSLSVPVTVTASNTQGGGAAPSYTFARNNTFTQIAQAESSNAILTIDPSTLALGNNWIYVRMKTSDTCYTAATGIDSILLKRDMTTGIIDPDNPRNIIDVYPNPFDQQIVIRGLSRSKSYHLVLLNASGQTMYSKTFSNTTTEYIRGLNLVTGLYWINLYDRAKNRKLGAVKITRR
jgi:hypothetical protein